MPLQIKVGGVWKTVATPSVKVGGVWKPLTGGFVKVAGVWKQFYTSTVAATLYTPNVALRNVSLAGTGGTRTVSFSLQNNGIASLSSGTGGAAPTPASSFTWLLSGVASDYQVTVTGSADNGGTFTGTLSSPLSLSTTRTFTFATSNNDSIWTGTYQIAPIAGGTSSTGTLTFTVSTAP